MMIQQPCSSNYCEEELPAQCWTLTTWRVWSHAGLVCRHDRLFREGAGPWSLVESLQLDDSGESQQLLLGVLLPFLSGRELAKCCRKMVQGVGSKIMLAGVTPVSGSGLFMWIRRALIQIAIWLNIIPDHSFLCF